MVEYKVGQKIKVKSLGEIKDFYGEDWKDMPDGCRVFLERNAGKVRTIKRMNGEKTENIEIFVEEDTGDFLLEEEIRPYNIISIPKEMFEI